MRAEILKVNSETPESSLVKYAADQIRSGEVLGMPTDTFYGLAADPFNLRAVDKVYDIKTRSRHKPLSLLIASTDQAVPAGDSVVKLLWSRWHRELGELAMEVLGPSSLIAQGPPYDLDDWQRLHLFSRADTIYGGSQEIQLGIIADRALGLPRQARS